MSVRGASRIAPRVALTVFVLTIAVASGCHEKVSLGSWERELTTDAGAAGVGGAVIAGSAAVAGSDEVAGSGGASGVAGGGTAGAGEPHVCRATGSPGPFNTAGDDVGVTITYTNWTWPSPLDSIEWEIEMETEPRRDGHFWSHTFGFENGTRGFFGLQGRGGFQADPPFGAVETTDMALFWISAEPVRAVLGDIPYPSARASNELENGSEWWTIHARYDWTPCTTYRMRVGLAETEPTGDVWFGAWILDTSSGEETLIGRYLVPAAWGKLEARSSMWSNRIGYAQPTSCAALEPSSVFFRTPTGDGGTVRPTSFVNRFDATLRCPSSRFTEFADGVRQELAVAPR